MNYKNLIKQIAAIHNTTPNEVDTQIRKAISKAGYNLEPKEFILMIMQRVKKTNKLETTLLEKRVSLFIAY